MTTYLAFLRAINLGPTRKFPKDDIVRVVESMGFGGVRTHINTGNVRFESGLARPEVERALEEAFLADRGFEVPTIAFTAEEFAALAREAAALSAARSGLARHYVYLLKDELPADAAAAVEARSTDAGEAVVRGRAVHTLLGPGYQPGSTDPLGVSRLLRDATARNVTVVSALAAKWPPA